MGRGFDEIDFRSMAAWSGEPEGALETLLKEDFNLILDGRIPTGEMERESSDLEGEVPRALPLLKLLSPTLYNPKV